MPVLVGLIISTVAAVYGVPMGVGIGLAALAARATAMITGKD